MSSIDVIAQDIHRFSSVSPAEEKHEKYLCLSPEPFISWFVRKSRVVLWRCLILDMVEMWEAIPVVRVIPLFGGGMSAVHYCVLLIFRILNQMWDMHTVAIVVQVTFCTLGCYLIYAWPGMCAVYRRSSVVVLSCLYHFMSFQAAFMNTQPGRSSQAALYDSFTFTICQFFFNRSTVVRGVLNALHCFSWHFAKITFPELRQERGLNLGHLLFTMAIYITSIYASVKLQPLVEREIERGSAHTERMHSYALTHRHRGPRKSEKRSSKTQVPTSPHSPISQHATPHTSASVSIRQHTSSTAKESSDVPKANVSRRRSSQGLMALRHGSTSSSSSAPSSPITLHTAAQRIPKERGQRTQGGGRDTEGGEGEEEETSSKVNNRSHTPGPDICAADIFLVPCGAGGSGGSGDASCGHALGGTGGAGGDEIL